MVGLSKKDQLKKKTRTHRTCIQCDRNRMIKFFEKPTSLKCNECKRKNKRIKNKPKAERKKLIRQLDNLIRDYIKTLPDTCCCCGKTNLGYFHPRENPYGIQVGHFITRTIISLRWDKRNCNPQCSGCNKIHQTNQAPYLRYMLKEYGKETIEELLEIEENNKHTISKIPLSELRELLEQYK